MYISVYYIYLIIMEYSYGVVIRITRSCAQKRDMHDNVNNNNLIPFMCWKAGRFIIITVPFMHWKKKRFMYKINLKIYFFNTVLFKYMNTT